jgi:hypothetical protein
LQWFSAGEEWFVDPRHILLALIEEAGSTTEQLKIQLFGPDAAIPVTKMPSDLLESVPRNRAPKLVAALLGAEYERRRFGSGPLRPEHLLLGLILDVDLSAGCSRTTRFRARRKP